MKTSYTRKKMKINTRKENSLCLQQVFYLVYQKNIAEEKKVIFVKRL